MLECAEKVTGTGNWISKYNCRLGIWWPLQCPATEVTNVHGKLWLLKVALPPSRTIQASGFVRAHTDEGIRAQWGSAFA